MIEKSLTGIIKSHILCFLVISHLLLPLCNVYLTVSLSANGIFTNASGVFPPIVTLGSNFTISA